MPRKPTKPTTPITEDDKQAMYVLYDQGKGRNDIATECGRGGADVTKIIHAKYGKQAFDRTKTKAATEARKADLAGMRGQLREKYLQRALEILDQIDEPYLVHSFGGKDNTYTEHVLDKPPASDIRSFMQSASYATTADIRIGQADADTGSEEDRQMLVEIADALGRGPREPVDEGPGLDAEAGADDT